MHRAALLAALALAACTGDDPAPEPSVSPTPSLPPDEPLLLAAHARTRELAHNYGGAPPALRTHVAEQLAALAARLVTVPSPVPNLAAPLDRRALIALVRRTSREDLAAAGRAADPAVALLLARLGASRAQHAVILGRAR